LLDIFKYLPEDSVFTFGYKKVKKCIKYPRLAARERVRNCDKGNPETEGNYHF